ncbi:DMT family transporter [Ideonella sp. BN130291]|uniref:DMT family transporter n=1 Tax=Ideonella sp. BN130291 TaxID=3112940 RepID=UPI002E27253A|nr:DMT family transporter [Ideonella sp. BN130291]
MNERKHHLDAVAVSSLLLCCLLWGLNQVAAKVALAEIPPLLQAGMRSLVAGGLVAVWARLRGIPLFSRDGSGVGGWWAGCLFAAEFACIFIGLQFTTASRMVVFIYLSPFVVALGMHFIARAERLRGGQWAGLLAAFAGVAWAFAEGFTQPAAGPRQWLGDALGVLAAVLWAATTLVIRATRLSSAPAEKTLLYQLAISGVLLSLAGAASGEHWPASLSGTAWAAFGFQTVVITFASYLVWFRLVRHYAATRLAAFTLLTPIFGLLAGVLLLGEPVTTRLVVALAAVALGIAMVNRR